MLNVIWDLPNSFPEPYSPPLDIQAYDVSVVREGTIVDLLFAIVLAFIILVYNFSFGCKIHISLALKILKRPIAPVIGFFCQFLMMPLVSKYMTMQHLLIQRNLLSLN